MRMDAKKKREKRKTVTKRNAMNQTKYCSFLKKEEGNKETKRKMSASPSTTGDVRNSLWAARSALRRLRAPVEVTEAGG